MKSKQIISILIVLVMILFTFINISYAVKTEINPNNYKPSIDDSDLTASATKVKPIVSGITTVGIIIAVISLMLIGIRYMIGSVEQKAEYKKTMMPFLIGCLLLFAVSTIVKVVYNMATALN